MWFSIVSYSGCRQLTICQGTPLFMATELLRASLKEVTISRTVKHDLEAVCWVTVYAIYKHALDHTPHGSREHKELRDEFCAIFSAISIQKLLDLRAKALSTSQDASDTDSLFQAIHKLQQYTFAIHKDLAGFLDFIWYLLYKVQPRYSLVADVLPKFRNDIRADMMASQLGGPRTDSGTRSIIELTHACLLKNIERLLSEQV